MHNRSTYSLKYNVNIHVYNDVYRRAIAIRASSSTSLAISKICSQDIRVTIRFSDRPRQFRLIGYQLDESRALCRWTNYDGFLGFRVRMASYPSVYLFPLRHLFRSTTAEGDVVVRGLNFHSTNTNDGKRPLTIDIYSSYRFRLIIRKRAGFLARFQFRRLRFQFTTNHNTIDTLFVKLAVSRKY